MWVEKKIAINLGAEDQYFPQKSGFRLWVSEIPLTKVSRVLKLLSQSDVKVPQSPVCCLVYFGERCASAENAKSTVPHTRLSISIHIDSTARKNEFQHFSMIAASRTNVYQQCSLFRRSLNSDEVVYVCVCVCACICVCVSVWVPWSFLSRQLLSSTS